MAKQSATHSGNRTQPAMDDATPFRHMLVAVDESPAAQRAVDLAAEWVGGQGAEVRLVQVTEERRQRGNAETRVDPTAAEPAERLVVRAATLGARNRQLVHGIAEAAHQFGADVIVLGFDRPRLSGHRLAPSLREQIVRVTDLPVLVAPGPHSQGKRHHRLVPDHHRDGERVHSGRGYAHV